ncbi:hypothetical protein PR202_ga08578 [Eleusine coracana subsp. coracana]|uniref:Uncharacterized protein n=1 Tax=Eleusine coracana subsp. coracana TaxID=191504 RepID=A0AAV5C0D0_ELECO|nr:hypothetical protein PR202_ga08578 [Eleusine coracana subsp. coracana]
MHVPRHWSAGISVRTATRTYTSADADADPDRARHACYSLPARSRCLIKWDSGSGTRGREKERDRRLGSPLAAPRGLSETADSALPGPGSIHGHRGAAGSAAACAVGRIMRIGNSDDGKGQDARGPTGVQSAHSRFAYPGPRVPPCAASRQAAAILDDDLPILHPYDQHTKQFSHFDDDPSAGLPFSRNMAEIAGDEAPPSPAPSHAGEASVGPSTSTPSSAGATKPPLRTTKPGVKRLVLTVSVLLSFLVGLPFLLKSTEIHRSPLPSDAIADLARRLQSNPPSFPCGLHAVFLRSSPGSSDASLANHLERAISAQLQLLSATSAAGNVTVSVTVDSAGGCSSSSSIGSRWQCGAVTTADLVRGDKVFDELLQSALGGSGGDAMRVYTVVVLESDDVKQMRIVVGKHRHAWVAGKFDETEAVSAVGKVFNKYFMNGGIEEGEAGIGKGEFMPVGSDGNVVLSFSLLNADPSDSVYDWEFEKIGERMLNPVVEALRPIAEINIESQVLYHTPKSSYSYSDDKLGGNVLSMGDIPFFMWGGVLIWNPPDCSIGSKKTHGTQAKMSSQELMETLEIFIGQLRQLFGLKPNYLGQDMDGAVKFLVSEKGFAECICNKSKGLG